MQTTLPWYVDSVSFNQCFCLAAASFGTELGPHLLMFLVILGNFQTIIHSIRVSSEWRFKWSQSLLSENSHSVIGTRTSKLNISFFFALKLLYMYYECARFYYIYFVQTCAYMYVYCFTPGGQHQTPSVEVPECSCHSSGARHVPKDSDPNRTEEICKSSLICMIDVIYTH